MIISTAPGFETFARTLLDSQNAESVTWISAGGIETEIKAIVRQKIGHFKEDRGFTVQGQVNVLKVAAEDVLTVTDADSFQVRGQTYRIARDGILPDGVAMVAIHLEGAPQ